MEQTAPNASSIHSQSALYEEENTQKRQAFDSFLSNFVSKTFQGLFYGVTLGILVCGKGKFVRYGALGAGIGAGIAIDECAHDFNKI
jgi:hypothetical protein